LNKIVVDASVILKWVLVKDSESDFSAAFEILNNFTDEKIDIHLPEIWKYEVGNILAIKAPGQAVELMEVLMDYTFSEYSLKKEDCVEIIKLQGKIDASTFYDVAYHYVAMKINGILITVDKKYFDSAKHLGHIELLAS
jgi:predicted nucleic acid-binding protein